MAELSFICKRTVVSTKPVRPGKTHALNALDRVMENNNLRVVYYYRSPLQGVPGELTKKLRESLSEMLSYFPMVTGRLQRNAEGRWMITCNDAGVRMVEMRAKGSIEEWLQGVDRERELQLVHWEEMLPKPYFWSTFYVQLTEFDEGGLAVGLTCTHLLADPICAAIFIKAWADTTLARKLLTPPFFHPLPPRRPGNKNTNHKPYTQLINHYKSCTRIERSVPVRTLNNGTVTLAFTDGMVRDCVTMAGVGRSPFEALAGLFWICVSSAKGMEEKLIDMSICLDMRKVLGLDQGFFGNCMVYNKVGEEGLEKMRLSEAALAIGEVVRDMDSEGIMDLIEWLDRNELSQSTLTSRKDLVCVNLETVDPFSAVFEEGFRPTQVSYYIEPICGEGQVLILPWQSTEGPLSRLVMVTLPEDEIQKVCENPLIRHFSPKILMGSRKFKH